MCSSDLVPSVLVLGAFGFDITRHDNVSVVLLPFTIMVFAPCPVASWPLNFTMVANQLTVSFQINVWPISPSRSQCELCSFFLLDLPSRIPSAVCE